MGFGINENSRNVFGQTLGIWLKQRREDIFFNGFSLINGIIML